MPADLTLDQIEKIGHSIIYLADRVGELSKTKLLKLLFIIEEKSIRDYGTPFYGLDFRIWQFGPVAQPVFEALSDTENGFLKEFIRKNRFDEYEGVIPFSDDQFSDIDLTVLDWAVNFARHKVADDLVQLTHSPDSLWRKGAIRHNVYDKFLKRELTYSNFTIDFTLLFDKEKDGFLMEKYNTAMENLEFSRKYKEVKRV